MTRSGGRRMRPIWGLDDKSGTNAARRRMRLLSAAQSTSALVSSIFFSGLLPGIALSCPASAEEYPAAVQSAGVVTASDPVVLLVVSGTVALAIASGLWAFAQHRAARRLQRALNSAGARTRALLGERDALLGAAKESLIVWGRDGRGPLSFSNAEKLLDSCLRGPESTELSTALDALSDKGTPFELLAHDESRARVHMRGHAVGGMAAVWIGAEPQASVETLDYRLILDSLPLPVWLRDRATKLMWGNRAFLSAVGAQDLKTAVQEQAALEKSERDLAASAMACEEPQEAARTTVIGGQNRALKLTEIPVDLGVIGAANDVTEVAAIEARLQQHIDAHTDTLDKLATAVAIFDRDQHLSFFNSAFAKLWDLPEVWLETHPSDSEVLDRLREERKLPEQRDYQTWKASLQQLFRTTQQYAAEELWHTPDGRNLRAMAQAHPMGGLTVLFEDVTERISLESSINTLGKVQSATLNSLREGVAVFGPDGRLKLHNAAFGEIWDLNEKDLTGEPHIRTLARQCAAKFATEAMWEKLTQCVVSDDTGQPDFGEIERSDRTILSLRLSPLPDGARLVTFADTTARFRIEGVLRERAEALEAADRLKSDFIKHVSYELRTPLNTILGFAEHLSSEVPGTLNERQREYMQAIVSSSNALKDLVNDILDLALVESGALRLELTRIELTRLLGDIAGHAREWAAKAGLTLELDIPETSGDFFADERRISQVIYNLLSNAIKYTPKGGTIMLGGRIEGEDVQLYVRDNGPGIDPELRANVFERFASKGTDITRGGAGLGLALVNRFIELHDGWVEIESDTTAQAEIKSAETTATPSSKPGTLVRCHLPRRLHDDPAPGGDFPSAAE